MRLPALLTLALLATAGPAAALPVGPSDIPDLHEPLVDPSCGWLEEWTEYGTQSPSPLPDSEWKRASLEVDPEGCADIVCSAMSGLSCCDLTGVTCSGVGVSCDDPSNPVCTLVQDVFDLLGELIGHQQGFSVPGTGYGVCVTYALDEEPMTADAQPHSCV